MSTLQLPRSLSDARSQRISRCCLLVVLTAGAVMMSFAFVPVEFIQPDEARAEIGTLLSLSASGLILMAMAGAAVLLLVCPSVRAAWTGWLTLLAGGVLLILGPAYGTA